MTYRQLLQRINAMTERQQDLDVTILNDDDDELYPVKCLRVVEDNRLDESYPTIVM